MTDSISVLHSIVSLIQYLDSISIPGDRLFKSWFSTIDPVKRRELILRELRELADKLASLREHAETAESTARAIIQRIEAGEM